MNLCFREIAVVCGQPLLEMVDLLRADPIQQCGRLPCGRAQSFPDLGAHSIVTPFEVRGLDAAHDSRRRLVGEPRVLRQGRGPVPGEERADVAVQLLGLVALEVEVMVGLPAQEDVGVVVGEARHAAA